MGSTERKALPLASEGTVHLGVTMVTWAQACNRFLLTQPKEYSKPGKPTTAWETRKRCHPCASNLKEHLEKYIWWRKEKRQGGPWGSLTLGEVGERSRHKERRSPRSCTAELPRSGWQNRTVRPAWAEMLTTPGSLLSPKNDSSVCQQQPWEAPGITWQVQQEENWLGAGPCPWRSRWQLQEEGQVQAQFVPGMVARSNSQPDANSWLTVQWVHQTLRRNIMGIKFPFWKSSWWEFTCPALQFAVRLHFKTSFRQPLHSVSHSCALRARGVFAPQQGGWDQDPGELTLPIYRQTPSAFRDENEKPPTRPAEARLNTAGRERSTQSEEIWKEPWLERHCGQGHVHRLVVSPGPSIHYLGEAEQGSISLSICISTCRVKTLKAQASQPCSKAHLRSCTQNACHNAQSIISAPLKITLGISKEPRNHLFHVCNKSREDLPLKQDALWRTNLKSTPKNEEKDRHKQKYCDVEDCRLYKRWQLERTGSQFRINWTENVWKCKKTFRH